MDRSLAAGYLLPVDCERFDAWLRLRNSGRQRVIDLVLAPSVSYWETCVSPWMAVKICRLDLADEATAEAALAGLSKTVADEMQCLESRSTR